MVRSDRKLNAAPARKRRLAGCGEAGPVGAGPAGRPHLIALIAEEARRPLESASLYLELTVAPTGKLGLILCRWPR